MWATCEVLPAHAQSKIYWIFESISAQCGALPTLRSKCRFTVKWIFSQREIYAMHHNEGRAPRWAPCNVLPYPAQVLAL